VETYGQTPAHSPASGAANPAYAPVDDILGRPRSSTPSLGAYEGQLSLSGRGDLSTIALWWSVADIPQAFQYSLTYQAPGTEAKTVTLPLSASEHTLGGLLAYTLYAVRLDVLNMMGQVLARSNELFVLTTDLRTYMPLVPTKPSRLVFDRG
jgi:hypothetical protein